MISTGRSESCNAYFDEYAHSNTMLTDLVVQYDKALVHREAEEKEDFQTMNTQVT